MPEYPQLKRAFRAGYSRLLPWTEAYEGETDLFIAGGMLWRTNYVLQAERPHAAGCICWLAPVFQAFTETGEMVRAGF